MTFGLQLKSKINLKLSAWIKGYFDRIIYAPKALISIIS